MTEWRAVVGFEGIYEVSDDGQVRTAAHVIIRRNNAPQSIRARLRKLQTDRQGYIVINLRHNGKMTNTSVHRLVAAAFIGPCPDGHEVNHKHGVKADNRYTELEYVTPSGNLRHKIDVLGLGIGDTNSRSRLRAAQIPPIRHAVRSGVTMAEVGRRYGVDEATIHGVMNGRTWSHVVDVPPKDRPVLPDPAVVLATLKQAVVTHRALAPPGEDRPKGKRLLWDWDVPFIRHLARAGTTRDQIADAFGVHYNIIWDILTGRKYGNVPDVDLGLVPTITALSTA